MGVRLPLALAVALAAALAGGSSHSWAAANQAEGADSPETVLVTVNGRDVTEADLEIEFLSRGVPSELRADFRDRFLEDLVDRRLVESFLEKRKAPVPEQTLERQMELVRRVIEETGEGEEIEAVLSRLGFTEDSLREHLSLPLAWSAFVRRTVTDAQLRSYFDERRDEFDGTEVRASQIVIAIEEDAPPDEWESAEQTLGDVRERIAAGDLSFDDAAREFSTSPSAKQGGDVGFFSFRGRLSRSVATVAFSLDVGELSKVFRTPFGVHLVTPTDRKPGELSLEDVRKDVWKAVIQQEWERRVAEERESARIRWRTRRPSAD